MSPVSPELRATRPAAVSYRDNRACRRRGVRVSRRRRLRLVHANLVGNLQDRGLPLPMAMAACIAGTRRDADGIDLAGTGNARQDNSTSCAVLKDVHAIPRDRLVEPALTNRNRLTTAFRLILAIPHLSRRCGIGYATPGHERLFICSETGLLGAAACLLAIVSWVMIVFGGRHVPASVNSRSSTCDGACGPSRI